MTKITVTDKKNDKSFEGEVNLGVDLAEAIELFGEERVLHHFLNSAKTDVRKSVRVKMDAEVDDEDIQTYLEEEWKLSDGTRAKKTEAQKLADKVNKLSVDEKEAFLAQVNEVTEETEE